jgi:signal transduction histidine kinase
MKSEIMDKKMPGAFFERISKWGAGATAIVDPVSYDVVFCNQLFEDKFGKAENEEGNRVLNLADVVIDFVPEKLGVQLQNVLNFVEERNKYNVYKLRELTGHIHSYFVYAAPIAHDNSMYYQLLLLEDQSKWKLPFLSFDTRELFLEQFNNMAFGTFEWILESNKIFWTEGIYHIYEIESSGAALEYQDIANYIHPEEQKKIAAIVKRALRDQNDVNTEMRIVTARNNIRIVSVVCKVLTNDSKVPVKIVGSLRDITEQRLAEYDVKKHVKELHRSNQELEEFAYVASHDLQEPLRKISTFSDRLNEKYADVLTGDGEMYLERIMASAENMRMLINNLLEFSRITRSTQPFANVGLNFIVHQVKTDLELIIEETGTIITTGKLPDIEASLSQMKQLFTNIINNAIKFRKTDVPPQITIDSRTLSADEKKHYQLSGNKTYYRIEVADNGIGFEKEYAQRIFQIFQRLHGKSEYPGSGIGLAICKKIVEHHHGLIFADSNPGKGSQFVIILPEAQPLS